MIDFTTIEQAAIDRLGSRETLESHLVRPEPPETLAMIGDDRYLSIMCRRIFRAGLTHRLVDARWPAFEAAFADFDPARVAAMTDDELKQLTRDETLIRHRRKLFAVRDNARAMQAIVDDCPSFGFWLAEWPSDRIVDLWADLKKRFTQLGGNSAPAFLRMVGKDSFMLTPWVVAALKQWGAYHGKSHTRAGQSAIQSIFNQWQADTDWAYCQLSQISALSIEALPAD